MPRIPGFSVWICVAGACAGPPREAAIPPLPHPRHGHRVEPLAGGLLVFGGFADRQGAGDRGTRETWYLPPGAARWQRRANLRTSRAFFGSAIVDGAVHAIGDGVERYDPDADRWVEVVPPGALPVSHFGAAAVGKVLWVLGGYPAERSGCHAVDLGTGAVQSIEPPPGFAPGDHFHLLHGLGGRLHVIGGLDGQEFRPRTEHWVRTATGWEQAPSPPQGLWAKFAVHGVVDGRLYVFSDAGAFCFDPREGTWSARKGPERVLVMPAVVAREGRLLVVGGVGVDGRGVALLEYDPARDRWRDLAGR
jgi:hypothetical protein